MKPAPSFRIVIFSSDISGWFRQSAGSRALRVQRSIRKIENRLLAIF
jgi:hypothetical protein